jgi:hypothetical protein
MRSLALRLFSHRLLAIARWDLYFLKLRLINRLHRQRSSIRDYLRSMQEPKYLNLGSSVRLITEQIQLVAKSDIYGFVGQARKSP